MRVNVAIFGQQANITAPVKYADRIVGVNGDKTSFCVSFDEGATWTVAALPPDTSGWGWQSATWNGTTYVASGPDNLIASSIDGVTWLSHTITRLEVTPIQHVMWNGSVFCAVYQHGGHTYTSPDGVNWTPHAGAIVGASFNYMSSTVHNGRFVVASQTNSAISADGVSWTLMSKSGSVYSIGEHLYVANSNLVYRSNDYGGTWTRIYDANGNNTFNAVIIAGYPPMLWGQDWFSHFYVTSSFDGAYFENTPYVGDPDFSRAVPLSTSEVLAYAYNSDADMYEQYKVTLSAGDWLRSLSTWDTGWNDLVWAKDRFVAGGYGETGCALASSRDGITWTTLQPPNIGAWAAMVFADSPNGLCTLFDASAGVTPGISIDGGATWTLGAPISNIGYSEALCWNGHQFLAINMGGTAAALSIDGLTWTSVSMPAAASWSRVAWNGERYCAISYSGAAATSTDGVTWVATNTPVGSTAIAVFRGEFVVFSTDDNTAYRSSDGVTWVQMAVPAETADVYWNRVCASGSEVVAISGTGGLAVRSLDLETWTLEYNVHGAYWYGLATDDSKFVCVAYDFPFAGYAATSSRFFWTGFINCEDRD